MKISSEITEVYILLKFIFIPIQKNIHVEIIYLTIAANW